jgi:hypothetical protein
MVVTSLTLNWHWFADLIAGLLIGGVVLQLTAAVDTAVPQTALDDRPRQLLRMLRGRFGHEPRATTAPPTLPPTLPPATSAPPPVQPRQDA